MDCEKAIAYIEGMTGCYTAIWHEWPAKDIEKLYIFVCVSDHKELTIADAKRVGIELECVYGRA